MADLIKLDFSTAYALIFFSCGAGFLFGLYNWFSVMSLMLEFDKGDGDVESPLMISEKSNNLMKEISEKIQKVQLYNFRAPKHSL